jgi:hypothetical protein
MNLGPLTKVEFEASPGAIGELCEFFRVQPEGTPRLAGYYDAQGKLRRVVAQYPDGWRLQVNCSASGYITSSHAKLRFSAKIRGAA